MEYTFKLILLGDYSSGKTSILNRFSDNSFDNDYRSTIGVDFVRKEILHDKISGDFKLVPKTKETYLNKDFNSLKNELLGKNKYSYKQYKDLIKKNNDETNIKYKLCIWDTSGQDKFSFIIKAYYRNISAAILVFDLTNTKSFESIESWHKDLMDKMENTASVLPIILVGNKCDLHKSRVITAEQCMNLANKLNCTYIETSAKENINIEKVFTIAVKELVTSINNEMLIPNNNNGITISNTRTEEIVNFEVNANKNKKYKCCYIM